MTTYNISHKGKEKKSEEARRRGRLPVPCTSSQRRALKRGILTAIDKKKERRAEREIREMGRSAQRAGGRGEEGIGTLGGKNTDGGT